MATRINLTVDNDIPDLLTELAGSERKRGEFISKEIRKMVSERNQEKEKDRILLQLKSRFPDIAENTQKIQKLEGTVSDLRTEVSMIKKEIQSKSAGGEVC